MMIKRYFFYFAFIITLVACGNNGSSQLDAANGEQDEDALQPLEVAILTEEDAFEPGKEGKIEIKVTKGDENVTDADDVQFEIWKQGHEDQSEKFEGKNEGGGIYSHTHTFDEEGVYYVIAHVTARGSHTMPQKEFKVGEAETLNHQEESHSDGHEQELSIHIEKPDAIKVNEPAVLTVHLQEDGKPFTEANVTFEYWQAGQDNHEFVDTSENKQGQYTRELLFNESGEYQLNVHVKKGEIHSHKEITFQVR